MTLRKCLIMLLLATGNAPDNKANWNNNYQIPLLISSDRGQSFGKSRILYRGDTLIQGPETVAAKGDYLLVTFLTSDGRLRLRRSVDGGATFERAQVLSDEGGLWPEVQFAPDGASGATLYIFWDSPSSRLSTNGWGIFRQSSVALPCIYHRQLSALAARGNGGPKGPCAYQRSALFWKPVWRLLRP